MTNTQNAEVSELAANFDHWNPEQAADPHRVFRELREKCPVAHSQRHGGFWVVTRYDDVEKIAKDTTTFSSRHTTVPRSMFGDFALLPPIQLDPPAHTAFRRLLIMPFTAHQVSRWEGTVRDQCRESIAAFIGLGSCEASSAYARHIPLRLMATMLGVPPADEELFTSWLYRVLEVGGAEPEQAQTAAGEMFEYLSRTIAEHRADPKDDLITLLMDSEVDGRRLSDEDLLGAAFLFIMAGMDTTWGMIGSALLHLASNPEDRERLAAEPGLIPVAVEEFVRYFAPVMEGRNATRTTEINGVTINEGDSVLMCFGAANRDPAAFADAETVIIDRAENRHLGFGVGVHRCLGAHLARLEVRIALEEWLRQIPEFWVSDPEQIRWAAGQLWGPKTVPLAFPTR